MAKSTFLQLCQAARRACAISGTGPSVVTGQTGILEKLVEWVQLSDMETQSRWLDWDFMHGSFSEPTIVGVADVTAPADIGLWDEQSFYLDSTTASYKKLEPLAYADWRERFRNGVKTNQKPSFVVITPSNDLKLEAPPDDIYTLTADYWKKPVKMVANIDTSMIPEEYERIIIARAKIMYAEDQGAGEVLVSAQVEFDDLLDKLEAKYLPGRGNRRRSDGVSITVVPA